MPQALIGGRSVFQVSGPEAEHLLQNVITTDLDALGEGIMKPGALLTPQGKIIADFLIGHTQDGFLLDCANGLAEELRRRLMMYKLRAKAEISIPEQQLVAVSWQNDSSASINDSSYQDMRFPPDMQVMRGYKSASEMSENEDQWSLFRIAYGVAECGTDYEPSSAFPHDVLMDFNGGISFKKGCFIGQEVVSRMQHRGTARRRIMVLEGAGTLPGPGTEITAGEKPAGVVGSVIGKQGLGLLRVDRASDALASGREIRAGDVSVTVGVPPGAAYAFPVEGSTGGED